jgi:hypothetical protein
MSINYWISYCLYIYPKINEYCHINQMDECEIKLQYLALLIIYYKKKMKYIKVHPTRYQTQKIKN